MSKSGSSPQMHTRWQHQIPSMYMLRVVGGWVGGGLRNLMLSSNLLKSKIPMLREGGWVGGFTEFDVEFKFAKIQNSYVEEGGWVGGGGFAEFDVEFKFAKIQNSYVEGGSVGGWVGEGGSRNLMLSSNLLKSKVSISMSLPPPPTHPPSLNIGILDFSKFEVNIKFRELPPSPGERWILVEATFDLGGQCLVRLVTLQVTCCCLNVANLTTFSTS